MCRLRIVSQVALLFALTSVVSCATRFGEEHYYQLKDEKTGEPTNYYRLSIDGWALMSSARYVSGYYDERAVDMFFNEIKIKSTDDTQPQGVFFPNAQNNPGTEGKITPLTPGQSGALVMVLSSNASSVTNTIGEFAQGQVVAQAITNLANRNLLTNETKESQIAIIQARAAAQEVNSLMALVPNDGGATTEEALLRVLNAIKRHVSPDKESFLLIDDKTKEWLENVR